MEARKAKCLLIFQMQVVTLAQRALKADELIQLEHTFDLVWSGGVLEGKEAVLTALAPRLESIADKTIALMGGPLAQSPTV